MDKKETIDKKFEKWAKAAGIRAVKTVAQTAAATIGTSAMLSQIGKWLFPPLCLRVCFQF